MSQLKSKKRRFQVVWTEKYGSVNNGDGYATCALCTDTITARTYNITRHFKSRHKNVGEMANDIRTEYIAKRVLHWEIANQNNALKNLDTTDNHALTAAYVISYNISTSGHPFTDADFVKTTVLICLEHLFNDFDNKDQILERIKEMPLTAANTEQYVQDMNDNIDMQLTDDLTASDVFSIALDEYIDNRGNERLAIIVRYASIENSSVEEELCIVMTSDDDDKNKANEVFKEIKKFTILKDGGVLDLKSKLFSITTNHAMAQWTYEFRKLMQEEVGHSILFIESIVHDEDLFLRPAEEENYVMKMIVDVVQIILSQYDPDNCNSGGFKDLLEEIELNYGDLLSQPRINWLSKGKVLNKFVESLEDIKTFLNSINNNEFNLNDKQWYIKVLFLTDLMNHYNDFKLRLQGDNHTILKIYDEWKSFLAKIQLLESDIKLKLLLFFPLIKAYDESENIEENDLKVFENWIVKIRNEFYKKFQLFMNHGEMLRYIIKPDVAEDNLLQLEYFNFLGVENFNAEMAEFKNSEMWVNKFQRLRDELESTEENHLQIIVACWTAVPPTFSTLKKMASAILSVFGPANKFDKIFSHMKHILSNNYLRHDNFASGIRLKMSKYHPELEKLTSQH